MATESIKPVRPMYRLLANNEDITATIADRLISIRFTDGAGFESDVLDISLSDADDEYPIKMPPTGAELSLYLGYENTADLKGIFICDEIEIGGWPGYMNIRARATPYDRSKGGKSTLQSQKRRIWKKGTRIGAMVARIAKEHGMEPAVSPSLKNVQLPTIDQSNESDINMLLRIGKKYDALVKPAAGKLVFARRAESQTISGENLPPVILTKQDITSWSLNLAKRDESGTVVAYYRVGRKGQRRDVRIGEGDPVHRIRSGFSTKEMATAAARAEYAKRQRGNTKLRITMPGRGDVMAEAPLVLNDFRDGVEKDWLISQVDHNLTNSGWVMDVEAELPNEKAPPPAVDLAVPKRKG